MLNKEYFNNKIKELVSEFDNLKAQISQKQNEIEELTNQQRVLQGEYKLANELLEEVSKIADSKSKN